MISVISAKFKNIAGTSCYNAVPDICGFDLIMLLNSAFFSNKQAPMFYDSLKDKLKPVIFLIFFYRDGIVVSLKMLL
jgi:hypothetical protein